MFLLKKPEDRSFKEHWLPDKNFKLFLVKKKDPDDKNNPHSYCNACGVFLANKKYNINTHMRSASHQTAMRKFPETQQQAQKKHK
jgi:hypothetical protein